MQNNDCGLFIETFKTQRQNQIIQFGNNLMFNLDAKYASYFDDNMRDIWTQKISEIITFYNHINNNQLKNEQIFNEKKEELLSEWNDICILMEEDYEKDTKHQQQQKILQREKQVNKLREHGLNIGINTKTHKKQHQNNRKKNKKNQRQKLKELKAKLAQSEIEQDQTQTTQATTETRQIISKPTPHNINMAKDDWSSSDSDDNNNKTANITKPQMLLSDASDNEQQNEFEVSRAIANPIKPKPKTEEKQISCKPCKPSLRAPIICVMGDVDAGKTEILDYIRNSNIGKKERITQQIGSTFISIDYIKQKTQRIQEYIDHANQSKAVKFKIPGVLFIDTPGHTILSTLRDRGLSVCDLAILVIDIHKALQDTTIQTINTLTQKKIPFIVAINKIDLTYQWKSDPNAAFLITRKKQTKRVIQLLDTQLRTIQLQFASKCGLNARLYSENKRLNKDISLVPISAISGEGIPDLLYLINYTAKKFMVRTLTFTNNTQASILEVKKTNGFGVTMDVIVCNGKIHKNDTMVICGINGPIITRIRELLLPNDTKQMSVKGKGNEYRKVSNVTASIGVRIVAANDVQYCVAGSPLYVIPHYMSGKQKTQMMDKLKLKVQKSFTSLYDKIDKNNANGVFVNASSLGTLESLINFLNAQNISVCGFELGVTTKKTVTKVLHQSNKVILAFNTQTTNEVRQYAKAHDVVIFESDIIYHLQRDYEAWIETKRPNIEREDAIFPVSFCILSPEHVYRKSNPMVFGVRIMKGILCVGTPICVKTNNGPLYLGCVCGIKSNDKDIEQAIKGDKVSVCIKCDDEQKNIQIGRHFEICDDMVSQITRESIDALKIHFRNKVMMNKDIISLIVSLKKYFGIASNICYRDDNKNDNDN